MDLDVVRHGVLLMNAVGGHMPSFVKFGSAAFITSCPRHPKPFKRTFTCRC